MTGLIVTILRGLSAILSIKNSLTRKDGPVKSPFRSVQIEELKDKLPSPLRVLPQRISRTVHPSLTPGLHLFIGASGVGKTREALEFIQAFGPLSGVRSVYIARGYVEPNAPLPEEMEIRNVVLIIDDYEVGFPAAAAASFEDRQAGYAEALSNLQKLYLRLKAQIDLHAFVVTLNTDRLPVTQSELAELLPQASFWHLPAVTKDEVHQFIEVTSAALNIRIASDALALLSSSGDGKFDIVATYLTGFSSGASISTEEVAQYTSVRRAKWSLFRSILSADQQLVYDQVKVLRDFGLPARSSYVTALLHLRGQLRTQSEVLELLKSIWPLDEDKAITYDGQFGPAQIDNSRAELVARAVLLMGNLRIQDRYGFQSEMKVFAWLLAQMQVSKYNLQLFRSLSKWYPYDRYFAYLLALAYRQLGHKFRAMLTLFQIFRRSDVRSVYSGKWIEIQCHLLLAQLYQDIKEGRKHPWEYHQRLEHEFEIAATLADLDMPDLRPTDFEVIYPPEPSEDEKKQFEREHKELGYEIPQGLAVESKHLRALVHHRYSAYLLTQLHREFDAMRHETAVLQLLPNFGEAYLNCAIAALQIGDSARALALLDQAAVTGPAYLSAAAFAFFLARDRWHANEDLGNLDEAKRQLTQCVQLVQTETFADKQKVVRSILRAAADNSHWHVASLLTAIRRKDFRPTLEYRIPSLPLSLIFPDEWKVSDERCGGELNKPHLIAMFSSQVIWDKVTRSPNDASLDIHYSMADEDLALSPDDFGNRALESMRIVDPHGLEWFREQDVHETSRASLYRCSFTLKGQWPKSGRIVVIALSNARFMLRFMCEDRAKHLFWEHLEALAKNAVQQLLAKIPG